MEKNPTKKVEKTTKADPSGKQHILFLPFEGLMLGDVSIKWHKNSDFSIKNGKEAQDWLNEA